MYDVIIIGAGPAGYTAALYASRANLNVLLFEGWQPGGQLTTTTEVENFPGHKDGITGRDLMKEIRAQAERFGAKYITKNVTVADFSNKPFKVHSDGEDYIAKSIIIATGAKPRMLGLDSEKRLWSKGVSACATCDGFFFRDKTVAVIGAGDSALEEAGFLTKFCNKVYLINRSEEFKGSAIMVDRVKANEKVEIILNKNTEEILGENNVTGLRLKDSVTGEESTLDLDGVFLAIGHIPVTELFDVEKDRGGYVLKKENTMTSVDGVFVAGDCADSRYQQAITAAGSGAKAAIDVERWLESQE